MSIEHKKNIIIAGGGIAGLLSALILSKSGKYNIHLVEKSDELGGLLKAFDYGENGKFDYGAHNILQTGISELDDLLIGLLPSDEWEVASAVNSQKRTLTGLYYNGELQKHSPFLDIRKSDNIEKYIYDFIKNIENDKIDLSDDNISAYQHAKQLFGEKISDDIIVPIFLKLFDLHPKEMNNMSIYLVPMIKIVLFNKGITDDLLLTKKLSSNIAYPDQEELPEDLKSSLKAYYPKKYGIYRVIEAMKERLLENGVSIYLNSQIDNIELQDNKIESVKLNNIKLDSIEYIIWSVGYLPLVPLLGIDISGLKYDKHPKTVITNILIDKPLDIDKLSYFYCYDEKFKTFRVDNYINYCSGAKRNDLYPISIEMILNESEVEDINRIKDLAIDELKRFNILQKDTNISFCKTEVLEYGFPLLSQTNITSTNIIREEVEKLNIKNLINIGILSQKNLFFESDVMKNIYMKLKELNVV